MRRSRRRTPRRVVLGLTEVAGFYGRLATGLRDIGVDATMLDLHGHSFTYNSEPDVPQWVAASIRLCRERTRDGVSRRQVGRKSYWVTLDIFARLLILAWTICRFDTYIFGYRTTFFSYRELPVLKALGKTVIYCFHGSDARPPYLDGALMAESEGRSISWCIDETLRTKRAVRTIERYADVVISHPPYGQFHERPFVSLLHLGVPMPTNKPRPPMETHAGPIRVVHAPSNTQVKGTGQIARAISTLCDRGYVIDFVLITGMPNSVVLAELMNADLLVDQLYSDTPMAGLATEAAAHSCPTLVCGYEASAISAEIGPEFLPPSVFVPPDTFLSELERLLSSEAQRQELGRRAWQFVRDRWAPEDVARRLLAIVAGEAPPSWWRDPSQIGYVHGGGLEQEQCQRLVRAIVAKGGREALLLSDKPVLEEHLLRFAGIEGG